MYDFGHMSIYEQARSRTRQRIVQAVLTCLLRDGYAHLTVTAIAAEADIGRGTFYAYFPNTDAALLAISGQYFLDLQADVHEMMRRYPSPEKEIRAWRAAFEMAEHLRPLFQTLNHPTASDLAQQFQQVMIEGFRDSLASDAFLYPQWMNLPLDVMATFTAGAVLSTMRRWLAGELAYSAEEMAQMVYKMLYHPAPDVD